MLNNANVVGGQICSISTISTGSSTTRRRDAWELAGEEKRKIYLEAKICLQFAGTCPMIKICLQVHAQWHAVLSSFNLHHLCPLEFKTAALEEKLWTRPSRNTPRHIHGNTHSAGNCPRLPIFSIPFSEWGQSRLRLHEGILSCALVQVDHPCTYI